MRNIPSPKNKTKQKTKEDRDPGQVDQGALRKNGDGSYVAMSRGRILLLLVP